MGGGRDPPCQTVPEEADETGATEKWSVLAGELEGNSVSSPDGTRTEPLH